MDYNFVYRALFFFNDTATTEIYTLSLHDALPIYRIDQLLVTRIDSKATALSPKLPDAKDKEESVA